MTFKEFQENLKIFTTLLEQIPTTNDDNLNTMIKRHIEQNLSLLNDVFSTSIDHMKKLQKVKTANEIICLQTKLANDISHKLSLSAQRFLNDSLGNIADYNEWLKAHCDYATD